MEKINKQKFSQQSTTAQPAHPKPAFSASSSEKEILALQEKARRFERRYPMGGYQGL
jgi:hypothetical protein